MSVFAKKIMISLTAGLAVIGGTVGTTIQYLSYIDWI